MPFDDSLSNFVRGNQKLKAPGYKQFVTPDILQQRLNQFRKILADPIYFAQRYFYIISLDGRKTIN